MIKSLNVWIPAERWSASGANASLRSAWPAWRNVPGRVAPGLFPPELLLIAVGSGGTIRTSPDGETWTQQSSGSQELLMANLMLDFTNSRNV